jgi:hypothetical protein
MQVLSRSEIDDDRSVSELTAAELSARRDARQELHLNFPGFSVIHFEMLLQIIAKVVIGWDMRRNGATENEGLFGECVALAMAIGEQGRKTLHSHITAVIHDVRQLQKSMFFGSGAQKASTGTILCKYHEHIVSTPLMKGKRFQLQKSFDHDCTMTSFHDHTLPVVVTGQRLRELRLKYGHSATNGKFAYCVHCDIQWTYEELVEAYVRVNCKIEQSEIQGNRPSVDEGTANIPKCRMLADIIEFQKSTVDTVDLSTSLCINAVYTHHLSYQTKGCFKCNKMDKRKHTCNSTCDCRM